MSRDPNCVFCKIIAVEIPASVVYESESVFAFLDNGPLAEGHLLVVSRTHYTSLVQMPSAECAQLATILPILARAVCDVVQASGFNILVNDGAAAGQVVPHTHFHIIPRSTKDGLGYRWNAGRYEGDRMQELAGAMQETLHRHV